MGNSIFSNEDYNSPFENWEEEDFQGPSTTSSTPNVELLSCKELENLPIKIPFLIKCKLSGIAKTGMGGKEYSVKITSSNPNVTISTASLSLEKGWVFLTNIESSAKGSASIKIKVDGTLKKTLTFKFVDPKDLFQAADQTKIVNEFRYVQPFADAYAPSEYGGNYCMAAAERGLSELLNNNTDFYAVHRSTHKRKNKVSFSKLTADDRAAKMKTKGYIHSTLSFKTYTHFSITLNKTFVKVGTDYKDQATVVKMKNPKGVYQSFLTNIRNEVGYHIYYCSIAGANHTMILIIDNTDPCDRKYEMWDQHGLSSSAGKLENIANGVGFVGGINSQVQWLVRWLRGVKKTAGNKKAATFYPQLTCNFYKIQVK